MTEQKRNIWIAAITRGHTAGVCLLKDGEIVFSIEEERITRQKYDGGPLASMLKILDYTAKLDHLVIAHTTPKETAGKIDFSGEDMYTGFARKLGLIDRKGDRFNHHQVIDLSYIHHKLHAACAFYRSGFEDAVSVIVDGAGTFLELEFQGEKLTGWETESILTHCINILASKSHALAPSANIFQATDTKKITHTKLELAIMLALSKYTKQSQSTVDLQPSKLVKLWVCFLTENKLTRFQSCLTQRAHSQAQIEI